eukprot:12573577-Alexandrium_andersonii.AAC.1
MATNGPGAPLGSPTAAGPPGAWRRLGGGYHGSAAAAELAPIRASLHAVFDADPLLGVTLLDG